MSEVERKSNDCNATSDVSQICQSFDTTLYIRYCNIPVCSTCLTKPEHKGHHLEENEIIYLAKENELKEYADKFESYYLPHFSREQKRLDDILKHHQDMIEDEKQKIIDQEKELKDKIRLKTDKLIQDLEGQWENILEKTEILKKNTENNIVEINKRVNDINSKKDCLDIETICNLKDEMEDFEKNVDLSYLQLPLEGKKYKRGTLNQNQTENIVGCLEKVMMSDIIDFRVLRSFNTNIESIESISVNEDDTIWTNSKDNVVREMDLQKEIKIQKQYPVAVRDIAITKSGDLLLAELNDTPSIKKLNRSGNLRVFYSHPGGFLRTPFSATALHVQTNGNVLVGFKKDNTGKGAYQKIIGLSPNGNRLRELLLAVDGKSLCTLPYRITANEIDDIIIVDQILGNEGRIVAIDKTDNLKWIYTGNTTGKIQNTFSPHGIVTTSQNNFIVCNERNNALHVLNENGQVLICQDISYFGLEIPYAIAINNKGHLLLSSLKQDEDKEKAVISVLRFTGC
ncbi:unnamed protein product [Mytilus coruscus]|uniref:B box-type domain-containing protein n=1 Tax=Mytilus coruscus TaxID=42192 RepID=A0A6J8EDF3_MYTCO|nr:unnamed protein product [Mytilus coruscus]